MKKKCFFCQHNISPSYKDINNLQKFLTPRKKIISSDETMLCAKHQRGYAKEIKRARYLGLLPYTLLQTYKIRGVEINDE